MKENQMQVRIVHFEGCPNHKPIVSLVREIADELSVRIELSEVKVLSAEDAVRERMLGSPTIQVRGVDIEPAARIRDDYAMSCRIFHGENGLPPREMIAAALLERDHDPQELSDDDNESGCCA